MKTTKTGNAIKYLGGGLLVAGIAYVLYNLLKRQPKTFGELAADLKETVVLAPAEIKSFTSKKYPECGFPLKKGCGGENVKIVQRWLNEEGNYGLKVDGKFGDKTENAVIDNQMPFPTFKLMHPTAVKGQVSKEFFDLFLKNA